MTKSIKRTTAEQAELDKVLAAHVPIISKAPTKTERKLVITNAGDIKVKPAKKAVKEVRITKSSIAQLIFLETLGMEKKVIVERMIKEAGLTSAGANTYIANYRRDSGLR